MRARRNKGFLQTLGYLILLVSVSATAANVSDAERLATIAEHYFTDNLALNPLEGTEVTGEARYEDKLDIGIAPEHRAKVRALRLRVQGELAELDANKLSAQDRLTFDLLAQRMRDELEGEQFPAHLLPIDQSGGIPVSVALLGSGQQIQPLKTVANFRNYLTRLERLVPWIDQAIMNMREGVRRGVVQPKALIRSGLPALRALTEHDLDKSPFTLAIRVLPNTFSPTDRAALTLAYREATSKRLQPAMVRLVAYVEKEYLPKCRDSAGIDALPQGRDWYAYLVRMHTTTLMAPEEIHQLGLAEVARIRTNMAKLQAHFKFAGSLTEFLRWADQDPQFRPFKTEQEVLDAYATLNRKVLAKLPTLFGRAPKASLEIRPEPELTRATASNHYISPTTDGSRPGVFSAVIEDATHYSVTGMTTLFLHEGQPGHHYHLAIQQELPLPKFRQHGWISAYGEGWALYAETLGYKMGLYDDPGAHLGHLNEELRRAVRLVTDTGLHARGWTREQSMTYMMETQGYPESEAKRATERYMAWPGQALAYKIGALKIQTLRQRAQDKLGAKFSLRDFHDLLLSDGALPLNLLEAKVDGWVAAHRG